MRINTDSIDSKCLNINSIDHALIEFTNRCNLRCVYCAANQPGYKENTCDLNTNIIDEVVESLIKLRIKRICVNGHGETTIYKGWDIYCEKLLSYGIPLSIISNFAKNFSEHEIEVFSRFGAIEVSCDTADPDLFSRLRRGANLETVIRNIHRVKECAVSARRPGPNFSWSCLVTDKNVMGLINYVKFAVKNGIRNINFCNLNKVPDVEGTLTVNHITEMPPAQLVSATQTLMAAVKLAQQSGLRISGPTEFFRTILQKVKTITSDELDRLPEVTPEETQESMRYYTTERPDGCTRDCPDAWKRLFIKSNRDVATCCAQAPLIKLDADTKLFKAVNSTPFKKLRRELLTGELSKSCISCPIYSWIPTNVLREKICHYLAISDNALAA